MSLGSRENKTLGRERLQKFISQLRCILLKGSEQESECVPVQNVDLSKRGNAQPADKMGADTRRGLREKRLLEGDKRGSKVKVPPKPM